MAFYFFIVAFISNRKQDEEKTYYDEPEIEKVKDITFGLSKIFGNKKNDNVENKDDTTSVPKIIQSTPIDIKSEEEMPTLIVSTPINSEQSNIENINQNSMITPIQDNLMEDEKKIITDEEII